MNALGMLEVLSIPQGIEAGDAMLKAAQVELITAQTVCAGKFIVIVGGEVAAVKESVEAGTVCAQDTLVDSIVIPHVHPDVFTAINACSDIGNVGAIGILETFSLAAAVMAADASVKAADVRLIEVRLGRGMGGKSFVLLTGEVAAVEAAVKAGESPDEVQGLMSKSVVIPSPHPDIINAIV
ncbi:BMC domain-containing protein [Christensenella timonensis]|uniref:BMC domain-containing protein n=1 Tax=Christensenella timonensis TaxID=1816678 RepID=UPI00082F7090|nr:BMC domain-containing protein [Christensenella timonensis]